jgi:hypothetical protein
MEDVQSEIAGCRQRGLSCRHDVMPVFAVDWGAPDRTDTAFTSEQQVLQLPALRAFDATFDAAEQARPSELL